MSDKETTRKIVEGYSKAWTSGDIETARSYLADDLEFRGSIDSFNDADSLISAISVFLHILKSVEMISTFYDESEAILMYDCVTDSPAGTIRTVEYFKVNGGKIREIKLVFDASELRKLMGK
jgi:SnoaL-like domain